MSTAPRHLSPESRRLWRALHASWRFRPDEETVLLVGLEALDLVRRCQAEIDRDGITVAGRDGLKQHPACVTLAAARQAFLTAMRQLGLGEAVGGLDRHSAAAANASALRRRLRSA